MTARHLHLYFNDHSNGRVGSPGIPMYTFAATPFEELHKVNEFGRPEATFTGIVCAECSDGWDCTVRHASVPHVRACWKARIDEDEQTRSELAAEAAVERYYEDQGYWEARAQEEYEMARGIWPY